MKQIKQFHFQKTRKIAILENKKKKKKKKQKKGPK